MSNGLVNFNFPLEYLAFLIPIIIIEWILVITALVHIFKHQTYKVGNRVVWVIVVLVFQLIGPIIYFVFGRSDE